MVLWDGSADRAELRPAESLCWVSSSVQYVPSIGAANADFLTSLVRETAGTAVYFATYESVKQYVVKWTGSSDPSHPLAALVGGSACGMISTMMVRPQIPSPRPHGG